MQQHSKKNALEAKSSYQPQLNERCFARLRTALNPAWIKCDILALSENGIAVRLYMRVDDEINPVDCWLGKDSSVSNRTLRHWEFVSISQKTVVEREDNQLSNKAII